MSDGLSGEHIDTTQHADSNLEQRRLCAAWLAGRQSEVQVLRKAGLYGHENKEEWGNVVEHSVVVNATAVFLAEKLASGRTPIDIETVDKASLLHDAAKRRDKTRGISYAKEHKSTVLNQLLQGAGYAAGVIAAAECTGRTVTMLAEPAIQRTVIANTPLEDLVVTYADARIRNTNIVNLETALAGNKAKVPDDAQFYEERWYPYFKNVEDRIFGLIDDPDFTPQSINKNAVLAMAAGDTY